MLSAQNEQMTIDEVNHSKMNFDHKSRGDIPKIFKGLQLVYTNPVLRSAIFDSLEAQVAAKVSKSVRRPGMPLWSILVCGVTRLDLNCDYDRLLELVNQHNSIREILGHGAFSDVRYHFQTPYGQKTHPSQFPDQRHRINSHRRQPRNTQFNQNL